MIATNYELEVVELRRTVVRLEEIVETQKQTILYERSKRQWYETTLRNKAMPIPQRLALVAVKELTDQPHRTDEDGWNRAYLPAMADSVGVSASTMSRGLKGLAETTQAIEHRSIPDVREPSKLVVSIRPTALLDRPGEIVAVVEPKRHGGKRLPCPDCGCEHRRVTRREECAACGYKFYEQEHTYNAGESDPLHDATTIADGEIDTPLHDETTLESDTPLLCDMLTAYTVDDASCNESTVQTTGVSAHNDTPLHHATAFEELASLKIWACHRAKRPYNARTFSPASTTDRATWSTYEEAQRTLERSKAWATPFDGIGIMLDGNYTVIDLDHCIVDGVTSQAALDRIAGVNSYAEVSTSGTGVHIITRGAIIKGVHKPTIEMYSNARFMVWTGNHIEGTPGTIESRQVTLDVLYSELNTNDRPAPQHDTVLARPVTLFDYSTVLDKASHGKNADRFTRLYGGDTTGYASASEADLALCNELAYYSDRDSVAIDTLYRASGLFRDKWDAGKGITYGERTIGRAIASIR